MTPMGDLRREPQRAIPHDGSRYPGVPHIHGPPLPHLLSNDPLPTAFIDLIQSVDLLNIGLPRKHIHLFFRFMVQFGHFLCVLEISIEVMNLLVLE